MSTKGRRVPRARAAAIVTVLACTLMTSPGAGAAEDLTPAGTRATRTIAQDDQSPGDADHGSSTDEPDRGRSQLLIIIAVVIGGVVGGGLGVRALRNRGGVPVDGENETDPPR
jgi:hypothetical protein